MSASDIASIKSFLTKTENYISKDAIKTNYNAPQKKVIYFKI